MIVATGGQTNAMKKPGGELTWAKATLMPLVRAKGQANDRTVADCGGTGASRETAKEHEWAVTEVKAGPCAKGRS